MQEIKNDQNGCLAKFALSKNKCPPVMLAAPDRQQISSKAVKEPL